MPHHCSGGVILTCIAHLRVSGRIPRISRLFQRNAQLACRLHIFTACQRWLRFAGLSKPTLA